MNRDDVIRMAREAGMVEHTGIRDDESTAQYLDGWIDEVERFASLVAAHERELCALEREAQENTPTGYAPEDDDDVVDAFAAAMKEKLAQARAKGRGGWQTCPPEELSRMLREHVEKGDPRDVANFCMFLWSLDHGIAKRVEP